MHFARLGLCVVVFSALLAAPTTAQPPPPPPPPLIGTPVATDAEYVAAIREHYTKHEHRIPMRDGVRLFTHVYTPKDTTRRWPILLSRTPYGIAPYGVDNLPGTEEPRKLHNFAPSKQLVQQGVILVHQDVRGRMMSQGAFLDVRPVSHANKGDTDETTDAWDTVDWLVKNVPGNNGRVGAWGISYPGFYAAQAAVDAHPALKAVSPQAPVTEWWLGDDFHHNGALFLADAFVFYMNFGRPRPEPVAKLAWDYEPEMGDIYDFFLKLGPLFDADVRHAKVEIPFWRDLMAHPDRDAWWQARDPRPHYRNVKPAVLTVGGWLDAEDLYGTLETYRAFETQSPGAKNQLVLGPWKHGGWVRTDGDHLGDISFQAKTSRHYQERIVTPFFLHHLHGIGPAPVHEAWVFETGSNEWRTYDAWPPKSAMPVTLWFDGKGRLGTKKPEAAGEDVYVSDPSKPVPYRDRMSRDREHEYMTEDQRFAARRPDVLVFATEPLEGEVTLAGPIDADLQIKLSTTDADFIVKLVDVFPDNAADPQPNPKGVRMGGYQMLVRGEVMRGRYRDGSATPKPFQPDALATVKLRLPDVNHCFRAGHRLMVQVQSTWFPLVDRNPQTFVDIGKATEADFVPATVRVQRGGAAASGVTVRVQKGLL
jgi:putative CocE/NonD family hydrolase